MFSPALQDPSDRLRVLKDLQILDTPPEQPYEDVVALVTHLFDAPMATVTLLDGHRQWFKAQRGMGCSESDIESSFCVHAVNAKGTLVVEDAHLDPRFANNPLVLGEPFIRFYAGAPVYADGIPVGTVCVIDYRPRKPLFEQIAMLEALARQVGELLSLRRTALRLARTEARLEAFMAHAPMAAYIKDAEGRYLYMSPFGENAYRADVTGTLDTDWIDPETLAQLREHEAQVQAENRAIRREFRATLADGAERDWSVVKFPFEDPSGGRLIGAVAHDITLQKDAQRQLAGYLAASRNYAEGLEDSNLQLERIASTDETTGLANNRAFQAELAARAPFGGFALVTLRLEGCEELNRATSDATLREVATLLRAELREDDLAGRLPGEEFGVLLYDATAHAARDTADRLRIALESASPFTVGVGVATCEPGDTREALLARADRSLWAAQDARRARLASV